MEIDVKLFAQIASKVLTNPQFRTYTLQLGKEVFSSAGHTIVALQQNPNTGSGWAQLTQKGRAVVQFKEAGKYIAVSVDGNIIPYKS